MVLRRGLLVARNRSYSNWPNYNGVLIVRMEESFGVLEQGIKYIQVLHENKWLFRIEVAFFLFSVSICSFLFASIFF